MRSGIIRPDEGFDILHNGVPRTFRDLKAMAYDAARYAKIRHPEDIIEIRDRATGQRILMYEDGRTG